VSRQRHFTEQIIHKLREAEVLIAQSHTVEHVCKPIRAVRIRITGMS
jgi:hypothetical protein